MADGVVGGGYIDRLKLAVGGVAMTRLPLFVVGELLLSTAAFAFILDLAKVPVFKRLKIA